MRPCLSFTLALGLLTACRPGAREAPSPGSGEIALYVKEEGCLSFGCDWTPDDTGSLAAMSLEASVLGDTVQVKLVNARLQCCAQIVASAQVAGNTYAVRFEDVSDTACDCNCCSTLSAWVEDVPAGSWTFEVSHGGETLSSSVTVSD